MLEQNRVLEIDMDFLLPACPELLGRDDFALRKGQKLSFSPVIFCVSWADLIPCLAVPGG